MAGILVSDNPHDPACRAAVQAGCLVGLSFTITLGKADRIVVGMPITIGTTTSSLALNVGHQG